MKALVEAFRRTVEWQGSTRALALVRIGFVPLFWAKYTLGMAWFANLEDTRLLAMAVLFTLSTLLVFVGYQTRWATATLALLCTVSLFFDNHLRGSLDAVVEGDWLVSVTLALAPCGRSLSLDRWLLLRRAQSQGNPLPTEEGPLWAQWIIMFQTSVLYFYAGIHKLLPAWTSGMRMDGIFLRFWGYSEALHLYPWVHTLLLTVAWFTIFVELFLVVGPWFQRTRSLSLAGGVALHLGLFGTLALWPLSIRMILIYVAFYPPQQVHDVIDLLLGRAPEAPNPALTTQAAA